MAHGFLALAAVSILGLATACGAQGGSRDVPFVPDDPGTDTPSIDPGPDAPKEPTVVTEDFRIAFPYQQYLPSSGIDLVWTDPANPQLEPDISFEALVKEKDEALSCRLGCVPDRAGRWLAVVVSEPPTPGDGSVVRLYRLFDGPILAPSGIPDVVNVRTFAFGTDTFVFNRPQYGCYDDDVFRRACVKFFRIDLKVPEPAGEESLFTFPPLEELDRALPPSGAFRMGDDGRTIIVLGTTLGSQSVWLWRGPPGPQRVMGPICAGVAPGGGCLESGSPYSDADPVALSPDGNHVVMALVELDRSLVLTHVDLKGTGARTSASLLSMPDPILFENACYNRFQDWRPTFIQPPLRFSPDGSEVLFVAGMQCLPNHRDRPWTNILALSLARIDQGGVLQRDDLRWITDFPQGEQLAASVLILPQAMDVSPSGDYVVFAGSPMLDSSGQPLQDGVYQLQTDSEIWVTRRDGTTLPVQSTARSGWKATSAQAIAVPPPPP